jgi:hypothetical protein
LRIAHKVRPDLVAASILILLLASSAPRFFSTLAPEGLANVPFEEKRAGLWIKAHSGRTSLTVISTNINPAYYAGAKHLYLPDEELPKVVEYAKSRQADFLVLSERRMRDSSTFDVSNTGLQDLDLVYHDQQDAGYEVAIYRFTY